MNILVHGTVLNLGGIAHHTRQFCKFLSQYHNVKIRNFNIPSNWNGHTGPDVYKDLQELEPIHHNLLHLQSLWGENNQLFDYPLSGHDPNFEPDFHLIMAEANHHYHYQNYDKPVIVYFPWETTRLHDNFVLKLRDFDYIWVPSEWQKNILVENGLDISKIKIVNEGIDPTIYFPESYTPKPKLQLLHIGTWEYRKSTYEIIKTFIDVFGQNDDVEFRIGVNNKFTEQSHPSELFKKFGLPITNNITFLDTLSEEDYVEEIKKTDFYISCSRSEGWNLPLIHAMASGIPSIYSKCSGQLEFTKGSLGIGIDIKGEKTCKRKLIINNNEWSWNLYGTDYQGNIYEPDYNHLKDTFELLYEDWKNNNYENYKKRAIEESFIIRENFDWNNIVRDSNEILNLYMEDTNTNSKVYYLIYSDSFGDTLASTPTLRILSNSHGEKINVVTNNKNVFKNNPYVGKCLSFDEFTEKENYVIYKSFTNAGRKDGNGIEKKFSRIDTRQLHSMDLGFQLLPEEMHYDFYPDNMSLDLNLPEQYVVLHITTNWPNRTWQSKNWQNLINWLSENKIYTVLIGFGYREELHSSYSETPLEKVCPVFNNLYGVDLTNQGSISDMWWVLNGAKALVTMDSGPLHLAGATDVNIIQLGSALNPKFRAPYRNGSQDYKYYYVGGSCNLYCNSNLDYNVREWGDIHSVPPQPFCLENKPTFECHPSLENVKNKLMEVVGFQEVKIKKMKFGIYTSFYNCEKFVDSAFKNIEAINYENFEWHITDDFSSDNTKKMVLDRLEKSPIKHKIKFYSQTEKKLMYWKPNLFFDKSFEWIILIDADDDFDKNFLTIYNNFLVDRDDVSLVSSDFFKVNENSNSLHSISYIINEEKISEKINKYHPQVDYLNNISYSCFGHLRGFRNTIESFDVDDMLACAEDSYHIFWSNSHGKYLHIPRPLYVWQMREDSESHSKIIPPNFNGNFEMSLNKLRDNDFGVDQFFNDLYLETCTLGSYPIGELQGKNVTLWSRSLNDNDKTTLKRLYQDVNLTFNEYNSDIHLISLNHFDENTLSTILENLSSKKLLFYYQNQKVHTSNEEKDEEIKNQLDYFTNTIRKFTGFSWWSYIRHFIIKN